MMSSFCECVAGFGGAHAGLAGKKHIRPRARHSAVARNPGDGDSADPFIVWERGRHPAPVGAAGRSHARWTPEGVSQHDKGLRATRVEMRLV